MCDSLVLERGHVPDAAVVVPGDKSLTHRAILFGALADGRSHIDAALDADDTRSSAGAARALGAGVDWPAGGPVAVVGRGAAGLREPADVVDCGNSGTTLRLMIGIATGIPRGLTVLTGDASLRGRPMRRVVEPLAQLGAHAWTRTDGAPPVAVRGGGVAGGHVGTSVPSAQVKSALLLAGLLGRGAVTVTEAVPTRDHTERLLVQMGARLQRVGLASTIDPGPLAPLTYRIPADPSAAAMWWVLAALTGGRVSTAGVLLNPTRTGLLTVLRQAGVAVAVEVEEERPEPVGRVVVRGAGALRPIRLAAAAVPSLVDEVPLVALLATQAHGHSRLEGLSELRVKETDRLHAVAVGLAALGAHVVEGPEALDIEGPTPLKGALMDSGGDHRLAFTWAVAASVTDGPVRLAGAAAVSVSYPAFWRTLAETGAVTVHDPSGETKAGKNIHPPAVHQPPSPGHTGSGAV